MASIDSIGKIEGSLQDGGWTATGAVFNDADRLEWYQEVEATFDMYASGWSGPHRGFRGHLLPDPWRKTFQGSVAPFSAFTAQEFMKRGEVQGIFFKEDASPGNWHQITGMQLADIVEHVLGKSGEYGHSNLVAGVWPEGIIDLDIDTANSTSVDEYEMKRGNYWRRLVEISQIESYLIYVDKFNVLHYIPHPMFDEDLPAVKLTIDNTLIVEPLTIQRLNPEQIGQVKIVGNTPRGLQLSGSYPDEATGGPQIVRGGYIATADTLMATIAERIYKFENREHTVTCQLPGAIGLWLDLLDRVEITYTSAADGITWDQKKFWLNKITVEVLADFNMITTVTMDAENA